ncbi:MAG: hypothetical protein R6U44_12045 [Archaeoglobaceae archaeon]
MGMEEHCFIPDPAPERDKNCCFEEYSGESAVNWIKIIGNPYARFK